jgi:hypothetical protein
VCGFKPPKRGKKKKLLIFTHGIGVKVAAGSPKELPRIPIFAWVLK